ncbi:MAG: zinc ribbon domain-containing protein [Elusimicrobia bacterium]|nr:zinc ribbon domain-containing protein [Elusimicrobiota bacterium]
MPIFEYKCLNCGENFEILVIPGREEEEAVCPKCASENIEKKLPLLGNMRNSRQSKSFGCSQASGGCDMPKRCCEL